MNTTIILKFERTINTYIFHAAFKSGKREDTLCPSLSVLKKGKKMKKSF